MALDFGRTNRSAAFSPQTAFPLDTRGYFESYDAALEAAKKAKPAGDTTTLYHYGLHVVVVENNEAKFYIIQPPRIEGDVPYLRELGQGSVKVDEASIVADQKSGELKLRGFDKEYYRYNIKTKEEVLVEGKTAADFVGYYYQDGAFWYESKLQEDGSYIWVAHGERPVSDYLKVEGFIPGLEPKVVNEDGKLVTAWFEPNPTTVEGLSSQITSLGSTVNNLNSTVSKNTELVAGLTLTVEAHTNDIEDIKTTLSWVEMK